MENPGVSTGVSTKKSIDSRSSPEMKRLVFYVTEKLSEKDKLAAFPNWSWDVFFSHYYHGPRKVEVLRDDKKISLEQGQCLWLMIFKRETENYNYKINLQNKFTILDEKIFNEIAVYYLKNNNIKQDIIISEVIKHKEK